MPAWAAEILEFQIALLDDPTLVEPALRGDRWPVPPPVPHGAPASTARSSELRGGRGRVFPGPRRAISRDLQERVLAGLRRRCRDDGAAGRAQSCSPATSRRRGSWRWTGQRSAARPWRPAARRRTSPCWPGRAAWRWSPGSAMASRLAPRPCSTPSSGLLVVEPDAVDTRAPTRRGSAPASWKARRAAATLGAPAVDRRPASRVEVMINVDRSRRRERRAAGRGRRRRPAAHRVPVHRPATACPTRSSSSPPIAACSTGSPASPASSARSTSAATSRCRASACRRRATRSWACAACGCAWSGRSCSARRSAPCCAPPCGRPLKVMLPMVAVAERAGRGARRVRVLPRRAARRRCPGRHAAARDHGRDAGRGRRGRPDSRRVLLHRQQRSDPVRHGRLARRRRAGGRAERSARIRRCCG